MLELDGCADPRCVVFGTASKKFGHYCCKPNFVFLKCNLTNKNSYLNLQVQANIWAVHNDPKLWNEPGKFLPQRFIDDHGNFISSNHVIPFSVGPRHCLGEQLARMEVFIFLVGMVQKFEFLPENKNKLPSIDKMLPSLALSPTPYKVIAKQI